MSFVDDAAEYAPKFRDHDCPRDDTCPHEGAFYVLFDEGKDEGDESSVSIGLHNVSAQTIIEVLIYVIESTYVRSKPDGMPAIIAAAQARQEIRNMLDTSKSQIDMDDEISQVLDQMFNARKGDADE